MSSRQELRIARVDAWLTAGGVVLTANERAARSVCADFDRARRAEGRSAWTTPSVFAWESWVREQWQRRNLAGLVLLNQLQEQTLWMDAIGRSRVGQGLLHRGRLADSALRAHRLLCAYAPGALRSEARLGWSGDPAVFSEWLEAFDFRCRREGLVSNSRPGLELTESLVQERFLSDKGELNRSPLLLIGFDRLLATQRALLDAWGDWRQEDAGETAQSTQFLAAPNAAAEVAACVAWLRERLAAEPDARLVVVTTALQERRGELERALLDSGPDGVNLDFEFSLGVALGQTGLVRSAVLLLRWLRESLTEAEVDWLIGAGYCAASSEEEVALAEAMRAIRRQGQERPEWGLEDFAAISEYRDGKAGRAAGHEGWTDRLRAARALLGGMPARQSPVEWAEDAQRLLDAVDWPGFRQLSSVAFQALDRWKRLLEDCGSLGFDGAQMEWAEFVATVTQAVSATIFAAESSNAPVQITEPLESAGQLADGIWFLGADEEAWPGRGQLHSLLPVGLQRETGMPHASPQSDWELARQATDRLLSSAPEVVFSYAKLSAGAEARPSRLAAHHVGAAVDLPAGSIPRHASEDHTETYLDESRIPFLLGEIGGGAATLTRQSLCPFQAFATARLGAEDWSRPRLG